MLPAMLLLGLAFSLTYAPLTMAAAEGVEEEEHGLAGGLLYTSMQFGMALGISTVTAISVLATGAEGGTAVPLSGIRTGVLAAFGVSVAAAVITATGLRRRRTIATSSTSYAPAAENA